MIDSACVRLEYEEVWDLSVQVCCSTQPLLGPLLPFSTLTPFPASPLARRYDRTRCEVKHIKDMQLLAAMAPPGGGRNHFSQRVSACFSTINVTTPNDLQLKRIFGTILNAKLSDFDDEVKPLGDLITMGTIAIYRMVSKELLPTPSKSHYLFNTRDLAKIIGVRGDLRVTAGAGGREGG